MRLCELFMLAFSTAIAIGAFAQEKKETKYLDPIDTVVPHVSADKDLKIDYDIAYVRAKRAGDKVHKRFFTDFSSPVTMERVPT